MPNDDELGRRYPHIRYRKHWDLSQESLYLLGECDAIVDAICQFAVQPEQRKRLLSVALIKGAQATTAIEGNTLTESEVRQVAEGESLPPSKEYQEREVKNILDAMNRLLDAVAVDGQAVLITPALVRHFHGEVGKELGEHFNAIPGQFRTDERVVGTYKCPAPQHVVELMDRLCSWIQREFRFETNQQTFAEAVVQAIVTHVYLEWIHPFGDGNGRTGRLLEFYILLRAGNPDIASHILSNFYNQTRPEYYRQLDQAGKTGDLSAFLRYAIRGYRDGLKLVMETIADNNVEVAWRHLVFSRFADKSYRKKSVFKRRRNLALAIPPNQTLTASQIMMLTPELAREYASLTERTLIRDLEELGEMEIVVQEDGKYALNLVLLRAHMARWRRRPVTVAA